MKILVPIDGSEFSKHSIEFVTSRATLLGHNPEIELLSVQAPVPARASKLIGNGSRAVITTRKLTSFSSLPLRH